MQTSATANILAEGYSGVTPSWVYGREPIQRAEMQTIHAKCFSSDCNVWDSECNCTGKVTVFALRRKFGVGEKIWICSECGCDLEEEIQ